MSKTSSEVQYFLPTSNFREVLDKNSLFALNKHNSVKLDERKQT